VKSGKARGASAARKAAASGRTRSSRASVHSVS
jgi:hypothetical protein